MKLTTVIRAQPEEPQALLSMMEGFNQACNWLSHVAFEEGIFHWLPLQRRSYYELRQRFGLTGVQATVAVRRVADSYKKDRTIQRYFRPLGAMPLHRHSYRPDNTIRVYGQTVRWTARPGLKLPRNAPEALLVYTNSRFFIHQPLETPTALPQQVTSYLGCDLGIVNILADSDGTIYSGARVNGLRKRHAKLRARLQSKGTRSSRRLLKKRRLKESRFARDVNHCISKQVVAKAEGTGRGIALEDLQGIRDRTTVSKAHRRQHHGWSFYQLQQFITYKAALAGMPVIVVDPRNTSRTCSACGLVDKANRISQSQFLCVGCGFGGLADTIAAGNIAHRAMLLSRPTAMGLTWHPDLASGSYEGV